MAGSAAPERTAVVISLRERRRARQAPRRDLWLAAGLAAALAALLLAFARPVDAHANGGAAAAAPAPSAD